MTILTPTMGNQPPTSRKSAVKETPTSTYCPRCNERGMFCFCDVKEKSKQAKALEVKRLKRGTFLFSFVGGAV